jgi:ribose transport system substrate-binding protein
MRLWRSRLLRGFLAILLLSQGACGNRSDSAGGSDSLHVGFVVANTKFGVSAQMGDGFRAGVSHIDGVTAEVAGPETNDGPKQLQSFLDLTRTARGGISVFTLTPEILAKPIADAVDAGIPVIAVDNPPVASPGIKLFVGNDNYELGRLLGREVIAKLPAGARGKIVIGTSVPGAKVVDRRARGIRDEFRAKMPGVTVQGPFDTKTGVEPNRASWLTLTTANKTALAFLGTGGVDGPNLAQIRRATKARWVAGAFDLSPKSLAAVKSGDLVLVSPEHFLKGEVAGLLQAQHAKNREPLPEGWLYIPGLPVNSANIDSIMARQANAESQATAVASQLDTVLSDKSYLRKMSDIK